jgi:hypothetical protein
MNKEMKTKTKKNCGRWKSGNPNAGFQERAELRKTIQEVEICDRVHKILFGRAEGTQRPQHAPAIGWVAAPADHRDDRRLSVQKNIQLNGQFGGSIFHKATIESQEFVEPGAVRNDAANDLTRRMELVLKRCNDSKVATASA